MKVSSNGIEMHYTVEGPEDAPVVVMSHSLASSQRMWDPQMSALSDYRVYRVRYSGTWRHGRARKGLTTSICWRTIQKACSMPWASTRCIFVGLSMGGMIGTILGDQVSGSSPLSVSLCATSSCMPEGAGPAWQERIDTARAQGMDVLVDGTIERWFSAQFIGRERERRWSSS